MSEEEVKAAPEQTVSEDEIEEITQLEYAHRVVRKFTLIGAGVGVIPLPLVDLAGVLAIQMKMISELSEVYQVKFLEHKVKNIIASLVGSFGAGLTVVPVLASALKLIPGVGTAASSLVAMPIITGGSTYALGQVFVMHFEAGGTLLDFDADAMHEYFSEQYQKGKTVATEVRKDETSA